MSIDLSKFEEGTGVEEEKDVLGGGGFIVPTDVYDCVIDLAYLSQSEGGANALNVVLKTEADGQEKKIRETIYFTNKQGGTTFEKDGKKYSLPGFSIVNGLCLLAAGEPLSNMTVEKVTYPIWNFDAGKELPTEVDALAGLTGQKVFAAIQHVIEDKNKKNDATGKYEPTGETRELNTIVKFFRHECRRTVTEIKAQQEKAEFIDKWKEKNQGQVINKAKGTGVKNTAPGAAAAGGAAPASGGSSLFAKS